MSAALLAAIQVEQAALYAYGLAGPRLPLEGQDLLLGGLAAHRARILVLRQAAPDGSEPGAPGGYAVAAPADADEARSLLAGVEARLSAAYADLAAATNGDERTEAVLAGCECAVRAVAWGGLPEAFPGW